MSTFLREEEGPTWQQLLEEGKNCLSDAGVTESGLDAWYLLEASFGIDQVHFLMDRTRRVNRQRLEKSYPVYRDYLEKRASRIPIQHILGNQEFMGLEFLVNEHVLIPRQDTEVLVETALDVCKQEQMGEIRLLDMCTGSGCILLSLLHELKPRTVTGVGVDLSKEALCVAEKNAEKLKIDAEFLESDLFENVKGTYDVVVSNPPYIRTSVIETLQEEVKDHDPYLALDGKEDGLYFYRRIIEQAPAYLKKKGWLLFEIGSDQGEDVKNLMEQAGYTGVSVKKDLAGLDRVVFGVYDR